MTTDTRLDRDTAIARIKAALRRRSGKAWSVTGGRGTAWGWIHIDAPPARRTWQRFDTGGTDPTGRPHYADRDTGRPGHNASPADRAELAALLGLETVHLQGESIPASSAHYTEYVDRAEGRPPRVIAQPYWD
jgi:hypothetical protein